MTGALKIYRRGRAFVLPLSLAILLVGCSNPGSAPQELDSDVDWKAIARASDAPISWREDVQPILDNRCVVCHGCVDAPCQLKLSSYEGVIRGANPTEVYNGSRIKAAQPTRLFIDAQSTSEWRDLGFHPVLDENERDAMEGATELMRDSVLYKMLRLKQRNPQPRTGILPASFTLELGRKQVCSAQDGMEKFERKNPLWGMPYALPNLQDDEYQTIVGWLAQGAVGPGPVQLSENVQQQVKDWESLLNGASFKERLVGRYIYEHLFIGHLSFAGTDPRQFFRLVRSFTPPGQAIQEIPTVRPFDDPGVDEFWYRLRLYDASIVAKSHVPYVLSPAKLALYQELFFEPDYDVAELPGYEMPETANPFKMFAAIPSQSRYRFMLDEARYFIQGFMKGPVCRGQVALNVIEDHFWVVFADPSYFDAEAMSAATAVVADYLKMPARNDTLNVFAAYTKFWDAQKEYLQAKQKLYAAIAPDTQDEALALIWDGDGSNTNAALTVFRNFDSAAVEYGLLGQYPETAWVINYALFERIHYLLVAGFDVYGNVGHQLNSRLFMDFLRMEGEDNFLSFLPIADRTELRDSWYQGIRSSRKKFFTEPAGWRERETPISFATDDTQREFYDLILGHLGPVAGLDNLNRCEGRACVTVPGSPALLAADKSMRRLARIRGERLQIFPENAFVRVLVEGGPDLNYSLIQNREWTNVTNFLENANKADRDPSGDTMTVVRQFSGAYPNFFFVVPAAELDAFVAAAETVASIEDYQLFVARYGVRRTAINFWEQADWFQNQYLAEQPVEGGILDLNRYENR